MSVAWQFKTAPTGYTDADAWVLTKHPYGYTQWLTVAVSDGKLEIDVADVYEGMMMALDRTEVVGLHMLLGKYLENGELPTELRVVP